MTWEKGFLASQPGHSRVGVVRRKALKICHMHAMEVRKKRPGGSSEPPGPPRPLSPCLALARRPTDRGFLEGKQHPVRSQDILADVVARMREGQVGPGPGRNAALVLLPRSDGLRVRAPRQGAVERACVPSHRTAGAAREWVGRGVYLLLCGFYPRGRDAKLQRELISKSAARIRAPRPTDGLWHTTRLEFSGLLSRERPALSTQAP